MRNASSRPGGEPPGEEPTRTSFACACCGRQIVTAVEGLFYDAPVGSERRFCDPACRQAAWRRRKAGVAEATPLQRAGGRGRGLAKDIGPAPGSAPSGSRDPRGMLPGEGGPKQRAAARRASRRK